MTEPASATVPPSRCTRGEVAAILAILAAAAVLRLGRLDLMEFKADEAEACLKAWSMAAGRTFPLSGLRSSVGIANPPLFIYLLALPLRLRPDPLAAAACIALANVGAIGLCWRIARRFFSPWIASASAAFYALSPWAVVFSRKIWAQDLLPVFACLFLAAAHAFLVERRPSAFAWLVGWAAVASQLHFSGFVLFAVAGYAAWAGRSALRARWVAVGLAAAFVLYLPYGFYLLQTHGSDFAGLGGRRQAWAGIVSGGERLVLALRYPWSVGGADGIGDLVGSQPGWVLPFALATGIGGFAGLVRLCVRDRHGPFKSARRLLVLWFVLPSAALIATGVVPFIHYFIILYPLCFLGLAAALEPLALRGAGIGLGAFVLVLAGFAGIDASLARGIAAQGGAAGDYGVAYVDKVSAVDYAIREADGRALVLWNGFNPGEPLPLEYRFLVAWREGARARADRAATDAYVLFDRFRSQLTERGRAATEALRHARFGPLTVYVVPLGPGA